MKSKSLLNIITNFFRKGKINSSHLMEESEIEKTINNNQLFNNNNVETDDNYFINLIPKVKEKIQLRKSRKRKVYYSTSFATSLSVILLYFFVFSNKTDIDFIETLTDNEINAIIVGENLINNENIFSLAGEEFIEQLEDNYANELKPEYYEDIKKYNIVFDIKDLDQEMLQAFHDKIMTTRLLGDL